MESTYEQRIALLTLLATRLERLCALEERVAALGRLAEGKTKLALVTPESAVSASFRNALAGDDQLRQRMALALHEIVVVSGVKIQQPSAMAPYLNMLLQDAFAKFYYKQKVLEDMIVVAGNVHEGPVLWNMVDSFVEAVGPRVMKRLILAGPLR